MEPVFATVRLEADFRYSFERKSLFGIGKSYVREEPLRVEFARVLRLPIIVTATHDRRVVSQTDIVGLVWRIRGILPLRRTTLADYEFRIRGCLERRLVEPGGVEPPTS